jgi:hypothetical protein
VLNPETAAPRAGGLVAGCGGASPGATTGLDVGSYLVLIVGVAQIASGAGQAWLSEHAPSLGWVAGERVVFNLGNASVIAGTLAGSFGLVAAGTALFALGIALFLLGTRGTGSGWQLAIVSCWGSFS